MPKRSCRLFIILPGILLLALFFYGPVVQSRLQTVHAASSDASLSSVDWANFTYSSSCYGNTAPFHTKNDVAVNGHVHFQVLLPAVYGDLTGSGHTDAVIRYQCSAADAMGVHAFVYTGNAVHPLLIGNLPLANAPGRFDNVTGITISQQQLLLTGTGYSANAPRCCPDLSVRMTYTWNGQAFVPGPASVSPLPVATQ